MLEQQPFEYSPIFYNEVTDYLETKWDRRLTDHEKHVLIEGYKFGRLVEMENEIKILDVPNKQRKGCCF